MKKPGNETSQLILSSVFVFIFIILVLGLLWRYSGDSLSTFFYAVTLFVSEGLLFLYPSLNVL